MVSRWTVSCSGRLTEAAAKKAGKTKPAAKSVVTMEVKPWGTFLKAQFVHMLTKQMTRQT
jgi:hypothetical protein